MPQFYSCQSHLAAILLIPEPPCRNFICAIATAPHYFVLLSDSPRHIFYCAARPPSQPAEPHHRAIFFVLEPLCHIFFAQEPPCRNFICARATLPQFYSCQSHLAAILFMPEPPCHNFICAIATAPHFLYCCPIHQDTFLLCPWATITTRRVAPQSHFFRFTFLHFSTIS